MDSRKKKLRIQRVTQMTEILTSLYKDTRIELTYSNDFECLVAVELSAQCTDKRVNEVTKDLFKKYTSIDAYANAPQEEMEQAIFSTGFYRNKARNIIAAAKMVRDVYGGVLPKSLHEMIKIPGVARKTANVLLSSLYGIQEGIAVDTHVRRLAIRFDLTDHTDPVRIERDLMQIVPRDSWWIFGHGLVMYGRHICKAHTHDCVDHPLTYIYPAANTIWPKSR